MLVPPIWIWKDLRRIGVHVTGALLIGLLKGLGTVALPDKNGIIYKFLTRDNWTLNNLDTDEFWLRPCQHNNQDILDYIGVVG